MTKSQSLKRRIRKVRGRNMGNKRMNGRDINKDNLTSLERDILNMLLQRNEPVSVKDIAVEMFGADVVAEAKGKESVRTIRNALRIPKSMDLLIPVGSGKYMASQRLQQWGFKAAEKTAMAWKEARDKRRQEALEKGNE